jgi:hypothetical protein
MAMSAWSQKTVVQNKDLMATISGFLSWPDALNYTMVCKLWQQSFLTRQWGSPAYLKLNRHLPINEKFIKYIKRFIVGKMENPQVWNLLRLTKISDLVIGQS